ncbi:MAG: gliding motility-associated C-terminal domain-containing protein [Chitinophagales bacterium]|nr:gliding motility-associated C-terminal domain-containing protein [Chitinophagales bacterium]
MTKKCINLFFLIFVFILGYAQKEYRFDYSNINNFVYYKYVKNNNKKTISVLNFLPSPQQNCSNAQPVCISQSGPYPHQTGIGTGGNEINGNASCLKDGEKNSVWYVITVTQSGNLNFVISPVRPSDDYDWAVFDITNHPCSAIKTNPALEISCNYSATSGATGTTTNPNLSSNTDQYGPPFNSSIPVTAGQTLALVINNYTGSTSGYSLDFSASTASMYDNVKPTIKSIAIDCNGKLKLTFSENIDCSSFTNSDFIIQGTNGNYTGTIVSGCTNGATYFDEFEITATTALPINENYLFNLVGNVSDNCGNISDVASIGFSYNKPKIFLGNDTTICSNNNLILDATTPNATNYVWNTGANTPTISVNSSGTYIVTVTANGCTTKDTIIITAGSPTMPSITISASKDTACSRENITFTATPINGGSNPTFQWYVNNVATGTNSNTFSASTLNNNDKIKVVMSNTGSCVSSNAVTSNIIKVTITPTKTPNINLTANQNNVCDGTQIIFTATPTNGGSNPIYQWYLNNQLLNNSSNTFISDSLNNNDNIKVVLTNTTDVCLTKTKDTSDITAIINPNLLPSVAISANQNNVCKGSTISFTATPSNVGSNISYQWYLNNNSIGNNSNTFTYSNFNNNDLVKVIIKDNSTGCYATRTGISNTITVNIDTPVTPTVNIISVSNNICKNKEATFNAHYTFGGNNPSFEWLVNNQSIGNNDSIFSTTTLNNNDKISVKMTSSLNCVTSQTATSNTIPMAVNEANYQTPSVVICHGEDTTINLQIQTNTNSDYILYFQNSVYNNSSIVKVVGDITQAIPFTINYGSDCYVEDTIDLTVLENPIVEALSDRTKVKPETVIHLDVLTDATNIIRYNWFPPDSITYPNKASTTAIVSTTTNYIVTVTDNNNCKGESSILVEVINICDGEYIAIPNAFTPNNDGINDCFKLISPTAEDLVSYNLKIFNRWSELVFESNHIENCWTGFYKNQMSEVDTYTYILQISCTNGTITTKTGSVALTK